MFTGLINHLGRFRGFRLGDREMLVEAPKALVSAVKEGDSLAVNGTCLTVTGIRADRLTFTVSRETIEKTTLGKLTSGDVLNLELPLTLSTPLGGHLVSGHVDTVGKVLRDRLALGLQANGADLPGSGHVKPNADVGAAFGIELDVIRVAFSRLVAVVVCSAEIQAAVDEQRLGPGMHRLIKPSSTC